jgi:hypothetical protein
MCIVHACKVTKINSKPMGTTGSYFAVHIVTFLPITYTYHIVTLAENCMFESFLGVSHFNRFTSHISRYLTLATIGQF